VLKVNNVLIYVPSGMAPMQKHWKASWKFFRSINRLNNVIIAESSASGSTLEGFDNYGYYNLVSRYHVKLVDLDDDPFETMYAVNERDFKPQPVRISRIILDPESYIVSVGKDEDT